MILTLQTTTFSAHGGIPTYNRMVCQALNESDDYGTAFERRVLIAMDRESDCGCGFQGLANLSFEAFGGNRFAFVRRAITNALRGRVHLVLIGHVNYALLGMILKRLRPRLRYGVMVHGIEVWRRLPRVKLWALQHADFVTAVSEYTKSKLVEVNGVQPGRIHILPNTIPVGSEEIATEAQRLRDETKDPKTDTVRLLSVARLESSERYKGVDTVIEALPAVIARVPRLQYVVVGSGTDLDRHKRLAQEKGVADRVHFLGSVDDSTLRQCYLDCDLFVLPSSGEGFGIVFLEAMNYGKPVIAASSAAAPEVVKDKETGLLVDYGNSEELASAITLLSLDAGLRTRLGSAGYLRLQQNFTFRHFKNRLDEIIGGELPAEARAGGQKNVTLADNIT